MNSKESSEDVLQRARMAMAKKNSGNSTTAKTIVKEIKEKEATMNNESVDFDTSLNDPFVAQPTYDSYNKKEPSRAELGFDNNQPDGARAGPNYHEQAKPKTKSEGAGKVYGRASSGTGEQTGGGGCCSIV